MLTSPSFAATNVPLHHFELQMDEQIHAPIIPLAIPLKENSKKENTQKSSEPHVQALVKPVAQATSQIEQVAPISSSNIHFQLWWLIAIPVLLMLIGLGWFLGQYMEQRGQHDKRKPSKEPWIEEQHQAAKAASQAAVKKADSQTESPQTPQEQPQLQTVQTTFTTKPDPQLQTIQMNAIKEKKRIRHEPAQPFDMLDIHKAYRCFLFSRDEKMMSILEQAFRYDPYDLTPYLMAIRILSESDREIPDLERLLRTALFLLRNKKQKLWKEVSQEGREKLPKWDDWNESHGNQVA